MANGFPGGNFRIVNKETGACIASAYGGQIHGTQKGVSSWGETGTMAYSHTADREFTLHDKVKNIDEELWYFARSPNPYTHDPEMLYNKVKDIRSSWVLGAHVETKVIGFKLKDHDIEHFVSLLPKQDEETLAHLKTKDNLNIVRLLQSFIDSNGVETIKSELVGKPDDKKLDEYLNPALAHQSIRSIEQKFQEYASSRFLGSYISGFENIDELYQIILASVQLDILDLKDGHRDSMFRLYLHRYNFDELLKKLNKEQLGELRYKVWIEFKNVEDPQKEAVKIILELRKTLDLHTDEKNMNTAKKILQTALKSNESFEQLQTALKNTTDKEKQAVHSHSGNVFLQGAGRQYQTYWTFEDGYIFVKGQPDAVLTCSPSFMGGFEVNICHRSGDPKQRWELKSA
ncbi:hypothetical protein [Acinetobacter pittii]|uniref:hypothetical protein n=1 Tax=Acinetobacter pittii TaxID=48296 RepID=UPI0024DEC677|nr:hypothetical protein [Acinetobacter pittii]